MEETAALFMPTDDLIYSPLHHLLLMVLMTPLPLPSWPYIYISYRGHNQLWEVGCRLFIDVQRHSNHTMLMSQSTAVINPLCIKPD